VYVPFSFIQILVFGLVFDVFVFIVVVAHIRYVTRLSGRIMALEASTDMLLLSQRELNQLIVAFLSKAS
jgi:hypothetical protein